MIYVAYFILSGAIIYLVYSFIMIIVRSFTINIKLSLFMKVILLFCFFVALVFILDYHSFFELSYIKSLIRTLKTTLELTLILLAILTILYMMIGLLGKKYTLRVENFNIGGINVFFDKSSEVFLKSVGTFIAAKRTLFYFDKQRDNISDVLDAYYEVYKFIRSNIDLLDQERDSDIAHVSAKIMKKLNKFLTTHQNDYRRWYNNVIEEDTIILESGKIKVHLTTIEDVQRHYYRYEEFIEDIAIINEYMRSDEVKQLFKINLFEWEEEFHA